MSRALLTVLVLTATAGILLSIPRPDSASQLATVRATPPERADAASTKTVSTALLANQPPIPLVRQAPATQARTMLADRSAPSAENRGRDDGDRKATAKAAIEADGYKQVTVLGRRADGTWQAKAYRGATEVLVAVDDTGRVSLQ
jgi:hypothetical protein